MIENDLYDEIDVSVIIPYWKNVDGLKSISDSLQRQTHRRFETIVVGIRDDDEVNKICRESGLCFIDSNEGRSGAKNLGASRARGRYLLFLDSDMTLADDTIERCLLDIGEGDALYLREIVVGNHNYWANARAIERNAMFHSETSECARFIKKHIFERTGGYDSKMEGFEDFDLHARLCELNCKIAWSNATIFHNEGGVGFLDYLKKRKVYAPYAEVFASRYPEVWRRQRSVRRHMELVFSELKSKGDVGNIILLPGLVIIRGFEFMQIFLSRWSHVGL